MTALTLSRIWRGGLALVVLSGTPALAEYVSVYVGTVNNLAFWQVEVAAVRLLTPTYAVNASVNPDVNDWAMSLSSDGGSGGALIPGLYPADLVGWNGVWFAYTTFYLPADALFPRIDVEPRPLHSLPDSRYATDDRATLQLNRMDPCAGMNGAGWMYERDYGPIAGQMNTQMSGSDLHPCFFQNSDHMTIDSIHGATFWFGHLNFLGLWVNNTGTFDPNAPSQPFGSTDLTYAAFDASVSYYIDTGTSVPEPHVFWLVLTGVGLMSARRWRHS